MFKAKLLTSLCNYKFWCYILFLDLSGIISFINRYIFSDITYLKWLMIVMLLDLITGVTKIWVHKGLRSVTSKGLRDTLSKVIQYSSFLIVTHVLTHYQVDDKANTNFQWISKFGYEFLILIEIKSVYENIIKIDPKLDFVTYLVDKVNAIFKSKNQ